jgi:uncharacterized protein (DUF1501 family)
VPYDSTHHALYQGLRSNITREALAGSVLTPAGGSTDGRAFALAPNLGTGLLPLFQQGRMAVLHNGHPGAAHHARAVHGTLGAVTKLFSHNDQQSYWQASAAEGATTGWGGRMGDLFMSANSTQPSPASTTGNAVYPSGNTAIPYRSPPAGRCRSMASRTACSARLTHPRCCASS